jgi:queuine tRNA-ribosyltransferase
MQFIVTAGDPQSNARTGVIKTDHGDISTPVFMPVGTAGTVKAVSHVELKNEVHADIILGNTYHLYLRPGTEILQKAGGLHRFSGWDRALLTDSGGYQVFSLADNRKITEKGVIFQSHIDGSRHVFTPENVVDIQRVIGADIMMALDECIPFPVTHHEAEKSMDLTHQWLSRGVSRFLETQPVYGFTQSFFPIVQGSTFPDLRRKSAEVISRMNMEGNAIGGLSVGEPADTMYEMIRIVNEVLPPDRPRYLMGVGTPANILEAVALGIDMFDCVIPTRNGRNGMLFTSQGIINIRNEKWKDDLSPVDPQGTSIYSTQYSKAYVRHLMISKEILGAQIASIHNLSFYTGLMSEAARKIREGNFSRWKDEIIRKLDKRL